MSDVDASNELGASRSERPRATKRVRRQHTELELLEQISSKLDHITAVLAAQGKERDKQIDILSAGGCDSALIGTIVGITAGAVRMHRTRTQRGINSNSSVGDEKDVSEQVDD